MARRGTLDGVQATAWIGGWWSRAMAIALVGSAAALVALATRVDVDVSDELRPERIVQRAANAVSTPDCSPYKVDVARFAYAGAVRELDRSYAQRSGTYREEMIAKRDSARSLLFMCSADLDLDLCALERHNVRLLYELRYSERDIADGEAVLAACERATRSR